MSDLQKYSKVETELLEAVQAGKKKSLSEIFPDDLDPKLVVKWSRAAGSLVDKKDGELAASLHIAGRFHALARMNPKVLEEAECKTIDEYTEKVLRCEQHRSTIYKFSSAYETFSELTPERAAGIGTENLVRATRIAKSAGASDAQKEVILEQAEKLSVDQFKDWGEKKSGLSAPGETSDLTFKCAGTTAEVREVEKWLKDERFVAWAGTGKPIGMILAAIQASSTEWGAGEKVDMTEPESVQAGQEREPTAVGAAEEALDQW